MQLQVELLQSQRDLPPSIQETMLQKQMESQSRLTSTSNDLQCSIEILQSRNHVCKSTAGHYKVCVYNNLDGATVVSSH